MSTRTKLISLFVFLATGLGFWVYCQTSTAQLNAPSASVVFCNPNKILQSYKKTIVMQADYIAEQDLMRQKLIAAQKEIQTKTDEFKASGLLPESPEYQKLRKELVERTINTETLAKVYENERRNQSALIRTVGFKDLTAAVQKLAKKKGYRLVLPQVLYGDETLDISNELIEQLNTDYELGR